MSARKDLRDQIVTAITALSTGATVDTWAGEEMAFNPAATFPAIYVAYAGCKPGELLELGATSYSRTFGFAVFVTTLTTSSSNGETQALTLLESIEQGITGTTVEVSGEGGRAEWAGEELEKVHLGHYLYRQFFTIEDLQG